MDRVETPQTVLVVDDDPDILTALQDLLEFEGFRVDCAQTCRQALLSIERNLYNAVLLDLGLPDGDGQSVLQRLQESDPSLPVIVLTAATSLDRRVGSLTQGAFAHLTKPYHREELRAILHRAIGMKSLSARADGIAVALSESEDRFRSLVQSAPDAIIVADAQGYIVSWNQAATSMFHYEAGEVLGRPLTILMPLRYRDAHEQGIERMRTTGRSRVMGKVVSLHGLRKDGKEFPIELSLATWTGQGESFYSGIIRDITGRTATETELNQTVERFHLLTNRLSLVFWMTDVAMNELTYVSPSYEKVWGRPCEELYRRPRAWLDAVHPDDRPRVLNAAMTRQALGTYREEYRIVLPDGTVRHIRDHAFPIRDASGTVQRIAGLAEDITAETERPHGIQQWEERVRQAEATSELGIWDWDCESARMYCSERTMGLLGRPGASRLVPLTDLLAWVHPPDRAVMESALTAAQEGGQPCVIRHRLAGTRQWLVWWGYPLRTNGRSARILGSVGQSEDTSPS